MLCIWKIFTSVSEKKLRKSVKVTFKHYFGAKWVTKTIHVRHIYAAEIANTGLTQWLNGKRKSMPFAIPMIWRESTNRISGSYFCLTKVSGYSKRTKSRIVYPHCSSALRPVTYSHENIPIPTPLVLERDIAAQQNQ